MTSTKISSNLALSFALALAVVGCGDDARPDTDASTGTDGGTCTDGGTGTDGGTVSGDFPAAQDNIIRAGCACFFADQGFATASDCVTGSAPGSEVAACNASALAANPGVGPYFGCLAAALITQKSCYDAAACDATTIDACDSAASDAADACTQPDTATATPYLDAINACIVGAAGACPDTTSAINTLGDAVFTGSTVGAGDDVDLMCTADTGGASADKVLQWAAPADGSYVIDTVGSLFDTAIQVQDACDSTTPLACNDDAATRDIGLRSRVTVGPLTAGQVILIVIEGYGDTDAGDYVINIEDAPPPSMDGGVADGGVVDSGAADAGVVDSGAL